MQGILTKVLAKIRPTPADEARMRGISQELLVKAGEAARKLGIQVRPLLVGSVARGTWLRNERDVDIFLLFPPQLSIEELETLGLKVAREMTGGKGKERFAEHPYLQTRYKGCEVDIVPCYDVQDPRKTKSSVDRTPHHQKFIEENLSPELRDQVLLLKQFFTGIGVYGAESRVMGFSGYLCELLILHYRFFENFLNEAEKWGPGTVVDIKGNYATAEDARRMFEHDPLIVVDPVDPGRNVAAAVSLQNFAVVIQASRDFKANPSIKFFFPSQPKLFQPQDFAKVTRRRGTRIFCISFRHPGLVEDVIYPQLRKTEKAITARLVQHGFEVFRSDVWADEKNAAILLELTFSKLPAVQSRPGPLLPRDASGFIQEHLKSPRRIAGPFIDSAGRVVFEIERAESDVSRLLRRILSEKIGFGKHVAACLDEYQLLEGQMLARSFKNRGFRRFVSEFFQRQLPWVG